VPIEHKPVIRREIIVKTRAGFLEGSSEGGVYKFYGIPFAAPPVGDLRWKAPRKVKLWKGIKKARRFGPMACQVTHSYSPEIERGIPESEDCLYLNVWTPSISAEEKMPVMVWIHGGGFINGAGSLTTFDGTELARKGVVLITFNYRLGPLGNIVHPDLETESANGSSGNYGVLDQIFAPEWIQKNIRGFGGNPDNVTIFGVSAGAMSVALLCSSPKTRGLIHRAICQSGGLLVPPREIPYEKALQYSLEIQMASGASGIEEMRKIPAEKLMKLARDLAARDEQPRVLRFAPILDEVNIISQDNTLHERAKIPLIIGSNKDEATFFTTRMPPVTVDFYQKFVQSKFGDKQSPVLASFPAQSDEEAANRFIYLHTSYYWTIPVYKMAKALSESGGDVYVYRFDRLSPKNQKSGIGVSHGEETPYVFGHVNEQGYAEGDKRISEAMMKYWVQFCKTGKPNIEDLPRWPRYTSESNKYLEFGDVISLRNYADDESFRALLNLLG
jgi:para-nitrobenzyl esterase